MQFTLLVNSWLLHVAFTSRFPSYSMICQSSLVLSRFSNADWTCDLTDRRSTTGYSFYLGDALIFWRSKKQTIVSRFNWESEYRALTDATSELIWLCWLLIDIGALNNYPLLFIMITAVPFKLLTMMSFMNEESTLRMIIILFAIIFKAILFNSNPSPPSTNNRYLHQNPPFFSLHSASSQNQGGIYSTLLSLKRVLS